MSMQGGRKSEKWIQLEEDSHVYVMSESHLWDLEEPPVIGEWRKDGGVAMLIQQGEEKKERQQQGTFVGARDGRGQGGVIRNVISVDRQGM